MHLLKKAIQVEGTVPQSFLQIFDALVLVVPPLESFPRLAKVGQLEQGHPTGGLIFFQEIDEGVDVWVCPTENVVYFPAIKKILPHIPLKTARDTSTYKLYLLLLT